MVVEFPAGRVLDNSDGTRAKHTCSISDHSAHFIKKRGRDTVFGYRVQLIQSEQGYNTSVFSGRQCCEFHATDSHGRSLLRTYDGYPGIGAYG